MKVEEVPERFSISPSVKPQTQPHKEWFLMQDLKYTLNSLALIFSISTLIIAMCNEQLSKKLQLAGKVPSKSIIFHFLQTASCTKCPLLIN